MKNRFFIIILISLFVLGDVSIYNRLIGKKECKDMIVNSVQPILSKIPFGSLSSNSTSDRGSEHGHDYVDLGLSVKWATCNIGASSPEYRGDYFAWGETSTKSRYDWDTYNMCRGSQYVLTEYNTDRSYGRVDNRTILDPSYDVAKVKWGGRWRLPTPKEFSELVTRCKWTKWKDASRGNPAVFKIEGPNGNYILLPTTGAQEGEVETYPMDNGNFGGYWTNEIDPESPAFAFMLSFNFFKESYNVWHDYRDIGLNVRPVLSK